MKTTKTWIDPYLSKLRQSGCAITRLQGRVDSPVLMLAPIPTDKEVNDNLAWTNPYAEVFFELMESVSPHGPGDFLIMPTLFGVPKRKKVSASEIGLSTEILSAAAKALTIKGFVCIGGETFRLFFGYGRKPSMTMLNGAILRVPQTAHKPLVVVPDLTPLLFSTEGLNRREAAIAQQQQRATVRLLEQTNVFRKIHELFK